MSNRPLSLMLVELGVTSVDGLAAPKAGHVDVQGAAARRRPAQDVRLCCAQREGDRTISSVANQQRLRPGDRRQGGAAALVAHFRVRAQQGATARIDAAQTGADELGLQRHLTQSNWSAGLIGLGGLARGTLFDHHQGRMPVTLRGPEM
jgi:hypothetical protein